MGGDSGISIRRLTWPVVHFREILEVLRVGGGEVREKVREYSLWGKTHTHTQARYQRGWGYRNSLREAVVEPSDSAIGSHKSGALLGGSRFPENTSPYLPHWFCFAGFDESN